MKFADVNLLEELQKPELTPLREAFGKRSHTKGEIIHRPDTAENVVFIVASGRVRVFLAYEDKEFTIALLEAGDIYTSHTGTFVEALQDTTLLSTDAMTFHQKAMSIPVITQTMVRVLGRILKNAFGLIDGLAFRDSTTRLAKFLLDTMRPETEQAPATQENTHANLSDGRRNPPSSLSSQAVAKNSPATHTVPPSVSATEQATNTPTPCPYSQNPLPEGYPEGPYYVVHLGMTGEQLAQHVGATRQTVSTLLSDMVRSNILQKQGRGIYRVLDITRLQELAQS